MADTPCREISRHHLLIKSSRGDSYHSCHREASDRPVYARTVAERYRGQLASMNHEPYLRSEKRGHKNEVPSLWWISTTRRDH